MDTVEPSHVNPALASQHNKQTNKQKLVCPAKTTTMGRYSSGCPTPGGTRAHHKRSPSVHDWGTATGVATAGKGRGRYSRFELRVNGAEERGEIPLSLSQAARRENRHMKRKTVFMRDCGSAGRSERVLSHSQLSHSHCEASSWKEAS